MLSHLVQASVGVQLPFPASLPSLSLIAALPLATAIRSEGPLKLPQQVRVAPGWQITLVHFGLKLSASSESNFSTVHEITALSHDTQARQ